MTESVMLPGYTLSSSDVEQERLRRQADDLRPHSTELFGRLGATAAGTCWTWAAGPAATWICCPA
ncbi:MAG TPA: hypothetical protein VGQ05_16990 [Streptosporangiaceae bacterium]|jgi:hypothetical protein|nr:hypothetical protein [Streptosporangiaceae bacterium]